MADKNIRSDSVVVEFSKSLTTKTRKDGNVFWTIAKGDCVMMLGLIRMKLEDFDTAIDTSNPGRFRDNRHLIADIASVMGDDVRPHVTKWGASHARGQLRTDEKRGNKRHIIEFIKTLNNYSGRQKALEEAYHECIRQHQRYWDQFSIVVVFQPSDELQSRIIKLLSVASLGRVQQGLVYSALRRRYGDEYEITTKKTFAADEQSSTKGKTLRGDVQVQFGREVGIALEVKDAVVDATAWERVQSTHGEHDYSLFVLATRYNPPALQQEISGFRKTYAVHLLDFFLTTIFITAADEQVEPTDVLTDVLNTYNDEFCVEVEDDSSIAIKVVEQSK